jgi:hypothetical protein
LGQQFVQSISSTRAWFHNETTAFHRDADLGAGLQLQYVEQRGRDG